MQSLKWKVAYFKAGARAESECDCHGSASESGKAEITEKIHDFQSVQMQAEQKWEKSEQSEKKKEI